MATKRDVDFSTAAVVSAAATVALISFICGCSRAVQKAEVVAPPPGPTAVQGPKEVVLDVYVPCAFADAAAEIAKLFEQANPGVRVNQTVENVSVLAPKIANGAKPDVFMCIGDHEVDDLDKKGLVESRRDFCFTSLALVVPQANPGKIKTVKDLAKPEVKTVAIADDNVSAGYYARKALEEHGLWEKIEKKLVRPKFPVELIKLASEGKAQASLAYAACYRAQGGEKKQLAAKIKLVSDFLDEYCQSIACAAAVIKGAPHPREAKLFVDFLTRPECQDIFVRGGFMRLNDPKCFPSAKEQEPAGGHAAGAKH
jgi:molybdate transport system substrate-binding protein